MVVMFGEHLRLCVSQLKCLFFIRCVLRVKSSTPRLLCFGELGIIYPSILAKVTLDSLIIMPTRLTFLAIGKGAFLLKRGHFQVSVGESGETWDSSELAFFKTYNLRQIPLRDT